MQGDTDILTQSEIAHLHAGHGAVTLSDALNAIQTIAEEYGESELKKTNQGTWKAILYDAGRVLGLSREALKLDGMAGKGNQTIRTEYDTELLDTLAEFYIHISQRYGKYITPYAFARWVGLPTDTLDEWMSPNRQNSSGVVGSRLKKLLSARAESITDKLYDSNNVTGQIMLANNVLGWDTSRSSQTIEHRSEPTTLEADFSSLGLETGKNVVQIDENTGE